MRKIRSQIVCLSALIIVLAAWPLLRAGAEDGKISFENLEQSKAANPEILNRYSMPADRSTDL